MDQKPPPPSLISDMLPYLLTVFFAAWGGAVNHVSTLRKLKKKFALKDLLQDLLISAFAGLITYHFCKSSSISDHMAAVLIGISGHMGTRAVNGFEVLFRRVVGGEKKEDDK